MQKQFSEYSKKEKFKLLGKFCFNVICFIFLFFLQMGYLTSTDHEERTGEGYIFRIILPLFFEIMIIIRNIKLRGFLKRNEKLIITGIITKKEAHLRPGRSGRSYFNIELDNQTDYEFENSKLFESLQTGMTVNLIFLEDKKEFTDIEIVKRPLENQPTSTPLSSNLPPTEIKTGLNEKEKEIIRSARTANIKRKLIFIIFFGIVEIPGLLLIKANPEVIHLIIVGFMLAPYVIYLVSISYRFNRDLRTQNIKCSYSIISDKIESDRILIKGAPEEFVGENALYIRCNTELFRVSKEMYSQCNAGTIVYMETARYSSILLDIQVKAKKELLLY